MICYDHTVMSDDEYTVIFDQTGVQVKKSRFPTGKILVIDGDETKKEFSRVGSDAETPALNYAQGLVEGKRS